MRMSFSARESNRKTYLARGILTGLFIKYNCDDKLRNTAKEQTPNDEHSSLTIFNNDRGVGNGGDYSDRYKDAGI